MDQNIYIGEEYARKNKNQIRMNKFGNLTEMRQNIMKIKKR